MGKGRARRKGGRKAYLKKAKYSYDPYSPLALRTRNVQTINIAGLVREPSKTDETTGRVIKGRLVVVEHIATQTHGVRGLTLRRAVGPTAKAPHVGGDPTMIPRAELAQKILDVAEGKSQWASQRYSGVDEWHKVIIWDVRPSFLREYWFCGQRHVLFERNFERGFEYCKEFSSKEALMVVKYRERITWDMSCPLSAPPS